MLAIIDTNRCARGDQLLRERTLPVFAPNYSSACVLDSNLLSVGHRPTIIRFLHAMCFQSCIDGNLTRRAITWHRRAFAAIIITTLAASVVQRYADLALPPLHSKIVSVHAQDDRNGQRPRMDQDSFVWTASLTPGLPVQVPSYHPRCALAETLAHSPLYEYGLYNRPPPRPRSV